MTTGKIFDVIVVGGGPVGSRIAYRVARAGYNIGVLEQKKSYKNPVCCTALVSQECVTHFELPREMISNSFSSARIFSPHGREIRIRRNSIQAFALQRPAFDYELAGRGDERGGGIFFGI